MLTLVFGPQTLVGQAYDVPRTEWGQPDLQGNWTNATLTPLERVEGYGPVYTQAQVDSLYRALRGIIDVKFDPSDPGVALRGAREGGGLRPEEVYWERDNQVARVDGEPRSSLIQFPGNGRIAEMTPQGEQRLQEYHDFRSQFGESDHPELRTSNDRCLIFNSNGGPPMLPSNVYNDNYTIVQNRDHVMIQTEMMHDARIIRLGERDPLPEHVRPWFGDSWGHWEGETLVVETTNIHDRQVFRRGLRVHSRNAKVIERFTRTAENTILYEFEVDDPDTYVERWGGQVPMLRMDGLLYEYACHEGNYSMEGILRGARYQESLENRDEP
jgi:hypothetical protein